MKAKKKLRNPIRSSQVPATAAMLYEMEERINSRMDARFAQVDSKLFDLKSEMHRVAMLVEDQNARNKYVMDGYAQLYDLLTNRG